MMDLVDEETVRAAVSNALNQSTLYIKEPWVRELLAESILSELQDSGSFPSGAKEAQERYASLLYDSMQQLDPDDVADFAEALARSLQRVADQAAAEAAGSSSEGDDDNVGGCAMCAREMRLTFHHLIPKDVHSKYKKKGMTARQLCAGVDICRPCHSAIHRTYDNKTLAERYYSLELLLQSEQLQRFIAWARKQRISTRSDLSNQQKLHHHR